jgi:hypothetical protein
MAEFQATVSSSFIGVHQRFQNFIVVRWGCASDQQRLID